MVNWENKLYSHQNFVRGAIGLLKSYLRMAELSDKKEKSAEETKEMEGVEIKTPLEEAEKLAEKAVKYHGDNAEVQKLAARIFLMRGSDDKKECCYR